MRETIDEAQSGSLLSDACMCQLGYRKKTHDTSNQYFDIRLFIIVLSYIARIRLFIWTLRNFTPGNLERTLWLSGFQNPAYSKRPQTTIGSFCRT